MSRFDYVKYDPWHTTLQGNAKSRAQELENSIIELRRGETARACTLALTALEECYMWIGKAIRDHQIAERGDSRDVPERSSE